MSNKTKATQQDTQKPNNRDIIGKAVEMYEDDDVQVDLGADVNEVEDGY